MDVVLGALTAMDKSAIPEIRRTTAYRVTVVGWRVFLVGFAGACSLIGLVALEVLPESILELMPIFMFVLIPTVIVVGGTHTRVGRMIRESGGGDGYQIGDQGTFFKLFLRDVFTGYRP
ncbi:hypothetical protein GCM10022251_73980 [Phytohabitans flavus]|uniref:Uncharacterized protein n=1 Tax=Phytohabitans flavus TaxID=1076124 RepID=A0A6F8XKY6_9ACTN|nr:hypothetical protein Pflav_008850 [Phytohabitans flavus]